LRDLGWGVLTVWQCQLKGARAARTLERIKAFLAAKEACTTGGGHSSHAAASKRPRTGAPPPQAAPRRNSPPPRGRPGVVRPPQRRLTPKTAPKFGQAKEKR
jgi:hypothetical protein